MTLLPIAVGALFLVYWRWSMRTAIVLGTMLVVCAVVLAPWVIRNRVQVGCYALTTDSRALWEANNPLTLHTLQHDLWIDNVPAPQRSRRARRTRAALSPPRAHRECGRVRPGQLLPGQGAAFLGRHPGEKGRLAAQASLMLWNPVVSPPPTRSDAAVGRLTDLRDAANRSTSGSCSCSRLRAVPRAAALCGSRPLLLAYQWLFAAIFVGATRYRVPWDFVAALLASAALVDLRTSRPPRRLG